MSKSDKNLRTVFNDSANFPTFSCALAYANRKDGDEVGSHDADCRSC